MKRIKGAELDKEVVECYLFLFILHTTRGAWQEEDHWGCSSRQGENLVEIDTLVHLLPTSACRMFPSHE